QAKNGMVKRDVVLVDCKEELHPEGTYFLDWSQRVNGERTRVRISAGKTAAEAHSKANYEEKVLAAKEAAEKAGIVLPVEKQGKRGLYAIVQAYLENEIKGIKKPKTYAAYKNDLNYFLESTHKQYLEDV